MSHFTCTHSKITNVDVLVQALKACGLEVKKETQIVGYNGNLSHDSFPIVGHSETLNQGLGYVLNERGAYDCHFHAENTVGKLMEAVARKYAELNVEQVVANSRGLMNTNISINYSGVKEGANTVPVLVAA